MARALVAVLGALLLGPLLVGPATQATAAADLTDGREITRYDVTASAAADGAVAVRIDLDFDFGNDPGHGPYLTFPTRVAYDDEQDRLFEFSDVRAESPTGAPAQVNREDDGSAVILRIGDPDVDDVSGVQTYRISFTVDGWINPANAQHSGDELYWDVIGPGWEVPLSDLTVAVTGPTAVEGAACFAGPPNSTRACTSATMTGSTATFTQDVVPVGDGFTTVTGWPGGTFAGVQPILRTRPDPLATIRPITPGGGIAAIVAALGALLVVGRVRRVGRDRAYLGATSGLRPMAGLQTPTGYRDSRAPVAVRLTPPDGARPGEIGTLIDERADPVDVTATIVDLAVREWLRIEEVPHQEQGSPDWTLVRLRSGGDGLEPFEAFLMSELFRDREAVRLSDLKTTFLTSRKHVQSRLYERVTEKGWFRANPARVRTTWLVVGGLLVGLGVIVAAVLAAATELPGAALVPIALALIGVLVMALSGTAPARTAAGTEVLAQAVGFRQHLATTEADRLRFDEHEDVFSRYLPYAIVFGLTDRWARVFSEAARERSVPVPTWYVGTYPALTNAYWATGLAGSMESFQAIATTAISAPTPGSSGGSGSSGGFTGGGVGGGGGGGW